MKLHYVFIIIGLLWSEGVYAQEDINADPKLIYAIRTINLNHAYNDEAEEVKGSPYLNNEFVVGEVIYDNRKPVTPVLLRYNIFKDQIEYFQKEKVLELLKVPALQMAILGEDTMVYRKHPTEKGVDGVFFRLVHTGNKVSLLEKLTVTYKPAVAPKAIQDPQPARYLLEPPQYFLEYEDGRTEKFGSIKKMIQLLPDHQPEMEAYVKKEKISGKKTETLKALLNYYHQL
ncbi:MAG: hypothetical protein R3D00_04360 [Bacteroidia bacterium]